MAAWSGSSSWTGCWPGSSAARPTSPPAPPSGSSWPRSAGTAARGCTPGRPAWRAPPSPPTPPALADDLSGGRRYDAACSAALAAAGPGASERARRRGQALAWLRADLEAYRKLLAEDKEKARRWLLHAQKDPDFASVREEAALAKLPEEEGQAWRKLWAEIADLLGRLTPLPRR